MSDFYGPEETLEDNYQNQQKEQKLQDEAIGQQQEQKSNQFENQLRPYKNIESNCRGNLILMFLPQYRLQNSRKMLISQIGQFYFSYYILKNTSRGTEEIQNKIGFNPASDRFEYFGGG